MLEEYNIDELNPRRNLYAKELKEQVTIKISPAVIDSSNETEYAISDTHQFVSGGLCEE